MKGNEYFEQISAGALSKAMPECKAVIVNIGNQKHILAELEKMYSAQSYKVFVVNTTLSRLSKVLERCAGIGVPCIVNCGESIPSPQTILPQKNIYSSSVISPGSYNDTKNSNNIISYLVNHPYATNASFLGYQGYYFSPDILSQIREKYFEEMRLGIIRNDITLSEPLLRDSQYCFVDLKSIRYSDYPLDYSFNPNGLYAEEMCQIARYIGLGQRLKAVFLFGQPADNNKIITCNKLSAEIIWHLCEGIASNIIEFPNDTLHQDSFIKKIVSLGECGQEITFVNSTNTDRWWMEILSESNSQPVLVPCSTNDYLTACSGEVPLRWLFFYQKYTLL